MRALYAVAGWLNQQDPRVQEQLATALLPFLGFPRDEIASLLGNPVSLLESWLTASGDISFKLGRLLTLRTLVDFCVGERFAGDGWAQIEDLYSTVLVDPRAKLVTREMAGAYLAELPALKLEWVRAGAGWRELLATSLSDLSLRLAATVSEVESVMAVASAHPQLGY